MTAEFESHYNTFTQAASSSQKCADNEISQRVTPQGTQHLHEFDSWFFDGESSQFELGDADEGSPQPSLLYAATDQQRSVAKVDLSESPYVSPGTAVSTRSAVTVCNTPAHSQPVWSPCCDSGPVYACRRQSVGRWDWDSSSSLNQPPRSEVPPTFDATVLIDLQALDQPETEVAIRNRSVECQDSDCATILREIEELKEETKLLEIELEQGLYQQEIRISKIKQTQRELNVGEPA